MTITKCEPCECIPGYVSTSYFYQAVLTVLCQINTALGGTNDPENPCDPCNCIEGQIPEAVYMQKSLEVACKILNTINAP